MIEDDRKSVKYIVGLLSTIQFHDSNMVHAVRAAQFADRLDKENDGLRRLNNELLTNADEIVRRALNEAHTLRANVTSCQTRNSDLVEENRGLKAAIAAPTDYHIIGARLDFGMLQTEHNPWARKNFGVQEWMDGFLGLVEEVGELAHSLLKQRQKIRGTHEEHEEQAKDAVGDIVVFLAGFCTQRGWNFQEIVEGVWSRVKARDWTKNKDNGGDVAP
jgi:NTP pyrophosphatase (non-canonical NTP hydrolase)